MTSKYDTYWQDRLDAILVLFDQARTAGKSSPLPLTGLDALGERGSWYGKLEIVAGQSVYDSTAHLAALGAVLTPRLPKWGGECAWVVAADKELQLTVEKADPQKTNWFEDAYRNAKQAETIGRAEVHLGPLTQEAAYSGWCQTSSGKRVYLLFTTREHRWLAPRHARLEEAAAAGGNIVISLTDETSGRFDLWIIPAAELMAAIQQAAFAPSLDRGNAYNFNLQTDEAADLIRQLNWDIRPYRRESGQTALTRATFWPDDGPPRSGEKPDLKQKRPALAKPFSEMFADWQEAEWAFDLLAEAAQRLGVTGPDDPLAAWTLRRMAGQYHLHFSYGQWLVLGLAGANGHLTLKLALFRDRLDLPTTRIESFTQKEGETPVSLHYLAAQAWRQLEDGEQAVFGETLDYIKQLFANWQASPYHKYTDPPVAQAIFDSGARHRLLSRGISKVESEDITPPNNNEEPLPDLQQIKGPQSFGPRAFELLAGLHQEPTRAYYQAHKDEFKAEIEEPLQRLMARVAEQLPVQVREAMETQQGIFGRFLKNDWGKGGAWDFYWGAFYPKGGKRTQDAQLFTGIHPGCVHFGFSVGAYAGEQRQRFQQNCKTHHAALVGLLSEVFADPRLVFGRTEGITIAADGRVSSREACTWEEFLADTERASSQVAVILPKATVWRTSAKDLIADMAQTFERLFPLVLLAVEDDPLPAIDRYLERIAPDDGTTGGTEAPETYDSDCFLSTTYLDPDAMAELREMLEDRRQIILYGPPGTGKTFVARELAKLLTGLAEPPPERMEIVQFHPAYSYEDFIEGIRPESKIGADGRYLVNYPARPGVFQRFCQQAQSISGPCVFIIDEINRGNIPRIFGELMLLLEYRGLDVTLAYSGRRFCIPDNVYLIGTMNTADRSIALVDFALRRRFHFFHFSADPELLSRWLEANPVEVPYLLELYRRLSKDAIDDPDFAIGPSHFMRRGLTETQLQRIWRRSIEPYLKEYYVDQRERSKADRWAWDGALVKAIRQGQGNG